MAGRSSFSANAVTHNAHAKAPAQRHNVQVELSTGQPNAWTAVCVELSRPAIILRANGGRLDTLTGSHEVSHSRDLPCFARHVSRRARLATGGSGHLTLQCPAPLR